jgi:glycosyltransferase involved in cell wall biosynthesis
MVARIALCLEQTLGHRSHSLNLEHALLRSQESAEILPIAYSQGGINRLPWALRGSNMARHALRQLTRRARVDVVFYHTQTVSLLAPWTIDRPYVVSVDATPAQIDTMAHWYDHRRGGQLAERLKVSWYRRVFAGANAVVAWSHWAAASLEREYGVDPAKVRVIHPGAPEYLFEIPRPATKRKPRILFVGGDLGRKGGDLLLEAHASLRDHADLTLMTEAAVPSLEGAGVEVLYGVRPGTPAFVNAFAAADIFCLPTRGDCTPVAIGEALAAGLPVVTTRIGSNGETVREAETGLLVEPGSTRELQDALQILVTDTNLRLAMSGRAREDARTRFSAAANADRVLDLVAEAAG